MDAIRNNPKVLVVVVAVSGFAWVLIRLAAWVGEMQAKV